MFVRYSLWIVIRGGIKVYLTQLWPDAPHRIECRPLPSQRSPHRSLLQYCHWNGTSGLHELHMPCNVQNRPQSHGAPPPQRGHTGNSLGHCSLALVGSTSCPGLSAGILRTYQLCFLNMLSSETFSSASTAPWEVFESKTSLWTFASSCTCGTYTTLSRQVPLGQWSFGDNLVMSKQARFPGS